MLFILCVIINYYNIIIMTDIIWFLCFYVFCLLSLVSPLLLFW